VRTGQCGEALNGTPLEGECGIYKDECKKNCTELTEEGEETCESRADECFLIMDEEGDFGECIDMVCCMFVNERV
jgi:hypothetical protein